MFLRGDGSYFSNSGRQRASRRRERNDGEFRARRLESIPLADIVDPHIVSDRNGKAFIYLRNGRTSSIKTRSGDPSYRDLERLRVTSAFLYKARVGFF
jgi:hypothetical protein